jgi:hypothetical protein
MPQSTVEACRVCIQRQAGNDTLHTMAWHDITGCTEASARGHTLACLGAHIGSHTSTVLYLLVTAGTLKAHRCQQHARCRWHQAWGMLKHPLGMATKTHCAVTNMYTCAPKQLVHGCCKVTQPSLGRGWGWGRGLVPTVVHVHFRSQQMQQHPMHMHSALCACAYTAWRLRWYVQYSDSTAACHLHAHLWHP